LCACPRQIAETLRAIAFPKRSYAGPGMDKWLGTSYSHACVEHAQEPLLCRRPMYVFGRYQYIIRKSARPGDSEKNACESPGTDWRVQFADRQHDGYIAAGRILRKWQALRKRNRTNGEATMLAAQARDSLALLQDGILCGNVVSNQPSKPQRRTAIRPTFARQRREGLATKDA